MGNWLHCIWLLEPAVSLLLPQKEKPKRARDLWKTTCFEIFAKASDAPSYAEFNFSPSGLWAAYDFSHWREGMADRPLSGDPVMTAEESDGHMQMKVALPITDLPEDPIELAMTAVIEEEDAALSYWAAKHADNDAPNFHHPSCFALTLGPRLQP